MEKHEDVLKAALMKTIKVLLPHYVAQRHEDVRTSGIPDISIDGHRRTSWWEAKHATPDFATFEYQELNCLRLAAANYCRYIVWSENKDGTAKRTLIIHPQHVFKKKGHVDEMKIEVFCVGYNHRWLCEQIRKVHL